jgi:hypothetical protein
MLTPKKQEWNGWHPPIPIVFMDLPQVVTITLLNSTKYILCQRNPVLYAIIPW